MRPNGGKMSDSKIKKIIETELEETNKNIEKCQREIGELYFNTHQISLLNGMELVKTSTVAEHWLEIPEKMIELEIDYALRGGLNFILGKIEKLQQK